MSFVIYTAIVNNYDYPRKIPSEFSGIDFVCFCDSRTQQRAQRAGWLVRDLPLSNDMDPTRLCRDLKIRPHFYMPEYARSLWVDANIQITEKAIAGIISLLSSDALIATFKHPFRDNVFDEAVACKKFLKDDSDLIDRQMIFLENEGFPCAYPLFETNVLYRRHMHDSVIFSMNIWWDILQRFSRRDQLSLGYALWKARLDISVIPGNARGGNPGFRLGYHRSNGLRDVLAYFDAYSYRNLINRLIFVILDKSIKASKPFRGFVKSFFHNNPN